MKAYLQKLCASAETPLMAQHLVREYLQARILQSLQRAGAMQCLAFHGGTALRFLFDIPRYSEDLDFALERAPEAYDFRAFLRRIERDFVAEAYEIDFKVNDKAVVHKAFVRLRAHSAFCPNHARGTALVSNTFGNPLHLTLGDSAVESIRSSMALRPYIHTANVTINSRH